MPKRERPYPYTNLRRYGGTTGGAPGHYMERPPQFQLPPNKSEQQAREEQQQRAERQPPKLDKR